jgi:hypothetical protein
MGSDKPVEGRWYRHRSDEALLVIGVDDGDGIIDVRDELGDVDEFDFDEWETMDLHLCVPPDGWLDVDEDEDDLLTVELEVADDHRFDQRTPVAHEELRIATSGSDKT